MVKNTLKELHLRELLLISQPAAATVPELLEECRETDRLLLTAEKAAPEEILRMEKNLQESHLKSRQGTMAESHLKNLMKNRTAYKKRINYKKYMQKRKSVQKLISAAFLFNDDMYRLSLGSDPTT